MMISWHHMYLAHAVLARCVRCQSFLPEHPECIGGEGCETCEYRHAKALAMAMFDKY